MTYSPNYVYWRTFDTLKIIDVALLMKGVEPGELGEIVVNDEGDGVDFSHEVAQIIAALEAGLIRSYPAFVACPDRRTKILKQELLPWLRSRGFVDLADRISEPTQAPPATGKLADAELRLKALRDLGGTVKPNKKMGFGWKFTGISKLVAQEKAAGYPRCDEKTIRADLIEAADAEKAARSAGLFPQASS